MKALWLIVLIAAVGAAFGGYYLFQRAGRRARSEVATPITWNDLTINPYDVDFNALLADWRWLVDESYQPLVISAFGDLFLEGKDRSMFWLDTGMGTMIKVAGSPEEFKSLMVIPEKTGEWFMLPLVIDLKVSGMNLGPGQCYSWKVPPVLSGTTEVSNVEISDLHVHFSILGQINRQVKDLPPGTSIRDIKINVPGG
jgi:Domain of unknown function (DUF1851)